MDVFAYIYGGNNTKIWGLTPKERMERILKHSGKIEIIDDVSSIPATTSRVLILNCRYILDERIIPFIIENSNIAIVSNSNTRDIIAINIDSNMFNEAIKAINREIDIKEIKGIKLKSITEITTQAFQKKLSKVERPFVLDSEQDDPTYITNKLYYGSYKGVTDIVTRLVWPKPAMQAVKFCVRHKITPNQVTALSLILAIISGLLFYINLYFIGLILAWFMTFLDTVDGKLARVTVTSTEFGNRLDHSIDIIHPLYWYACWGYGLKEWNINVISLDQTVFVIFIFYILGRLCEGAFQLILKAPFTIFCWRPFDSIFRLVTARRNPNLIILTIFAALGACDIGLFIVALWTVISTTIMVVRIFLAYKVKKENGRLSSWLADIDPEIAKTNKIYRLFIY
jgi:phosphatidylglycerophosphate synthase